MGVSKNRGIPKWMVYNGKPNKMDDFGVPLFLETPIWNTLTGDRGIVLSLMFIYHRGQGRGILAADLRFLGRQQFGLRG